MATKPKAKAKPKNGQAAVQAVSEIRRANKKALDAKKSFDKFNTQQKEARKSWKDADAALRRLLLEQLEPNLFNQEVQRELKEKEKKPRKAKPSANGPTTEVPEIPGLTTVGG